MPTFPSLIFSPNIYIHIFLAVLATVCHFVSLVLWLPQRETRDLIPLHALLRFSTSENVSVNLFPVATHGVYVIPLQDTFWRAFLRSLVLRKGILLHGHQKRGISFESFEHLPFRYLLSHHFFLLWTLPCASCCLDELDLALNSFKFHRKIFSLEPLNCKVV